MDYYGVEYAGDGEGVGGVGGLGWVACASLRVVAVVREWVCGGFVKKRSFVAAGRDGLLQGDEN